jgi:hypothetical protein
MVGVLDILWVRIVAVVCAGKSLATESTSPMDNAMDSPSDAR